MACLKTESVKAQAKSGSYMVKVALRLDGYIVF